MRLEVFVNCIIYICVEVRGSGSFLEIFKLCDFEE